MTNAQQTLDEVNSSTYSSTRYKPIFFSAEPRGTRASPNYNNEIPARSRPSMKNGRVHLSPPGCRTMFLALQGVTQYPSENGEGDGRMGGYEAVSDQCPQGEGENDWAEMQEIERERNRPGGEGSLHYRDV